MYNACNADIQLKAPIYVLTASFLNCFDGNFKTSLFFRKSKTFTAVYSRTEVCEISIDDVQFKKSNFKLFRIVFQKCVKYN